MQLGGTSQQHHKTAAAAVLDTAADDKFVLGLFECECDTVGRSLKALLVQCGVKFVLRVWARSLAWKIAKWYTGVSGP